MINNQEKQKGDIIWIVKHSICEMLKPIKAIYISPESPNSTHLAFIELNQKKTCYPTNMIFDEEREAEIYAAVTFIKLYYSFDPYTIIDEIDETLLTKAHNMIDEYEELYPDKFLKYWMHDVPNR